MSECSFLMLYPSSDRGGGLLWEWLYNRGSIRRVASDGSGFIRGGGWLLMGVAL